MSYSVPVPIILHKGYYMIIIFSVTRLESELRLQKLEDIFTACYNANTIFTLRFGF